MAGGRPCTHWAQYKCNYGEACNFSHEGPGGPSPRGLYPGVAAQAAAAQAVAPQQEDNPLAQLLRLLPAAQAVASAAATAAYALPAPAAGRPKSARICTHWQQNRCNYGDACSFSHDAPGGPGDRGQRPAAAIGAAPPAAAAVAPELVVANEALAAIGIDLASLLQAAAVTPGRPGLPPAVLPSALQACPYWQMGRCKFADSCKYSHDSVEAGEDQQLFEALASEPVPDFGPGGPAPRSQRLCTHWAQFKCNYGDGCRFSHDGPGGPGQLHGQRAPRAARPRAAEEHGQAEAPPEGEEALEEEQNPEEAWRRQLAELAELEAQLQEAALPPQEGSSRPGCNHWAQYRCNFGDQCRFSHDGPGGAGGGRGPPPGGPRHAQQQQQQQVQAPPAAAPKKSRLCLHWQQYRCNYGDQCGFSHDCPGGPSVQADPESPMEGRGEGAGPRTPARYSPY